MKYSFLLIGEKTESMWPLVVEQALSSLGIFQMALEEQAVDLAAGNHYDVIMLDSATVRDPVGLISKLRSQQPEVKIVVVTASPTWQRAREALQAGADDYFRKSLDVTQIRSKIQALLAGNLESEQRPGAEEGKPSN